MPSRVVLITGSCSGIGKETAYKFANDGATVIITHHSDFARGEKVKNKCLSLGAPKVLNLHLDLLDDRNIKEVVSKAIEEIGHIDILINNAGMLHSAYFKDMSFDDISVQLRTNLEGLIKFTKECLPHVKESIINIGSSITTGGHAKFSVYAATKYGVKGFTKSLAMELPDLKVFAFSPGMTATKMVGFKGADPAKVAEVLFLACTGRYKIQSGEEIHARDYLDQTSFARKVYRKIKGRIVPTKW